MSNVSELLFTKKDLPFRWSQIKHDFWGDLKQQTMKAIKDLIEHYTDIEIQDLVGPKAIPGQGSIFIGTKGCMLLPHIAKPSMYPEEQFKDFEMPKE